MLHSADDHVPGMAIGDHADILEDIARQRALTHCGPQLRYMHFRWIIQEPRRSASYTLMTHFPLHQHLYQSDHSRTASMLFAVIHNASTMCQACRLRRALVSGSATDEACFTFRYASPVTHHQNGLASLPGKSSCNFRCRLPQISTTHPRAE